jgi:hypothetical protein
VFAPWKAEWHRAKYDAFELQSDLPLAVLAERRIARLPDPRRGSGAVKRARL